jgi:hypothetical protein
MEVGGDHLDHQLVLFISPAAGALDPRVKETLGCAMLRISFKL